jgi:hypothetical protein
MRVFSCDRCDGIVPFAALDCPTCGTATGYDTAKQTLRTLAPTAEPAVFRIGDSDDPDGQLVWRCLNAAWGCNWLVPVDSDTEWCRSCRLTRGRPDIGRHDAIEAWMVSEAAKRRVVHQLDVLALPITARSDAAPDGVAFDLVHVPGEGGITGHLDGVITLDLAEIDDKHRDDLRRLLDEPFRTVIGHLRHELGHHYFARLVGQSDDLAQFRRLFGDERDDYTEAVERHYAKGGPAWDSTRYVTPYAAVHPLEDWAETFAHYLHVLDAVDTAIAHHLVPPDSKVLITSDPADALDLGNILDTWVVINRGINAIAETLGARPIYPIEPSGVVIDKLQFVHQQVAAHTERDRFYAEP